MLDICPKISYNKEDERSGYKPLIGSVILRTRRYRDENKISQPTPFALICSHLINAEGFYFKNGGNNMKQTIEGFNQEYALKLEGVDEHGAVIKLDHTDLVILRWFTDIYPTLPHEEFDGRKWVMMTEFGSMIFEDLPLLNLSTDNCSKRLFKLVRLEILDYCDHCDGEPPEPFLFFTFGKNYELLCGQRTAGRD